MESQWKRIEWIGKHARIVLYEDEGQISGKLYVFRRRPKDPDYDWSFHSGPTYAARGETIEECREQMLGALENMIWRETRRLEVLCADLDAMQNTAAFLSGNGTEDH